MARALTLAARGLHTTDPNPRVGCIVVNRGKIVGEGWHRRAGQAHAEVIALAEAGVAARGATVYVTLEPCSHQGKTPPCADALVDAGVAEVVVAMNDSNPRVSGQGSERLSKAGIVVRSGLMEAAARELNIGFDTRHRRGRPWVRIKLAASLDGRTAAAGGESRWITGKSARDDVQRWRARASAVLTGIGTVLADDPGMNARLPGTERQPLRVIADSRFRTPPDARLFSLPGPVIVAGCEAPPARAAKGEWLSLPPDEAGRVDLKALLKELARREVNELHVEAGPALSGALVGAGLADELLLYLAPTLLGDRGRPLMSLPGLEKLEDRHHLEVIESRRVGEDWRLRFKVKVKSENR